MIALLLCTGIREGELCSLEVEDLRQSLDGELALRVREGKGNKQRLIPYGELDWCLRLLEAWLKQAGIEESYVFRGLYKSGEARQGPLSTFSVQRILAQYPITVNGRKTVVKPHDCRRTYARHLFDAGVELVAIQQNLGHASLGTTQTYIGILDATKRRGRAVYSFDFSKLYQQALMDLE